MMYTMLEQNRQPSSQKATILTIVGLSALFVAFGAALYRTNAVVFSGSDASAKIVSATLALVGAFLAAVVSLIGMLLKHSIDRRAEARLRVETERNAALERESAARLKMEAAIRAIQLLATSAGTPTLPLQRAGALLALSSLGQHQLTLALLAELLDRGECEPSTIAFVINNALVSGDASVQVDAMAVLYVHAPKLLTKSGFEWPGALSYAVEGLSEYVNEWAPLAIAKLLASRSLSDWLSNHYYAAGAIVASVGRLWRHTHSEYIRINTGAIIREVLLAFPDMSSVGSGSRKVDLDTLRGEIHMSAATSAAAMDAVVTLQKWRTDKGRGDHTT